MTTQPWDIYLGSRWVDRTFFDSDIDREQVYKSLVNHDGYRSDIRVVKGRGPLPRAAFTRRLSAKERRKVAPNY